MKQFIIMAFTMLTFTVLGATNKEDQLVQDIMDLQKKVEASETATESRPYLIEIIQFSHSLPKDHPEEAFVVAHRLAEYYANVADLSLAGKFTRVMIADENHVDTAIDFIIEQKDKFFMSSLIINSLVVINSERSIEVLKDYMQAPQLIENGNRVYSHLNATIKYRRYDPGYYDIYETLIFYNIHPEEDRERYLRALIDSFTYRPLQETMGRDLPTIEDASPEILLRLHSLLLGALNEFDFQIESKGEDFLGTRELVELRLAEVRARMDELGLQPGDPIPETPGTETQSLAPPAETLPPHPKTESPNDRPVDYSWKPYILPAAVVILLILLLAILHGRKKPTAHR